MLKLCLHSKSFNDASSLHIALIFYLNSNTIGEFVDRSFIDVAGKSYPISQSITAVGSRCFRSSAVGRTSGAAYFVVGAVLNRRRPTSDFCSRFMDIHLWTIDRRLSVHLFAIVGLSLAFR